MSQNSSNKLILKNTLYLYLRMFLVMALSLYTSRIVIDVLGIEDYGLYNVIGGIIVLLNLLNSSMVSATQRFLTYEIGVGNTQRVSQTFSMSMTIHLGISAVLLILGETVGLWYVLNHLSIPEGRETAAFWVYQISLVSMVVNIIRTPYNAAIISYEKMSFYAVITVVDMVFRLLIIFLLLYVSFDKLILYALLGLALDCLVTFIYKKFCQKKFTTCNYKYYMEKSYFKKLLGFLGWTFVGGLSTMGVQQVGNLIINAFCGVAANAAYAVATRVNMAVNQFVTNFQTAFRPQIVKLYAQKNTPQFVLLMNRSAILSYYLLFLLAFPIFVHIDTVLSLWLTKVPEYSGIFCQLVLLTSVIYALQAPLWMAISATGNIKGYNIWTSAISFLSLPLLYLFLKLGYPPYWVMIVKVATELIMSVCRVIHVKVFLKLPMKDYMVNVLLRVTLATIAIFVIWYFINSLLPVSDLLTFIRMYIIMGVISLAMMYTIGVGKIEREFINSIVQQRFDAIKGYINKKR